MTMIGGSPGVLNSVLLLRFMARFSCRGVLLPYPPVTMIGGSEELLYLMTVLLPGW